MIPIPPWALPVGVVLTLAAGFGAGWQTHSWKADADRLEAFDASQRKFNDALAMTGAISADYEQQTATAREVAYERSTEIRTYYRDVEVPAECAAPASVASVLQSAVDDANAATTGELGTALPPAP